MCIGEPLGGAETQGAIVLPLQVVHMAGDRRKVIASATGKEACTSYRVVEIYSSFPSGEAGYETKAGHVFSLLLVRLHTGRKHQIRAHLASIGRPLIADATYGAHAFRHIDWCPRMFLHCRRVHLHDLAGNEFAAEAYLPGDLVPFLAQLQDVSHSQQPGTRQNTQVIATAAAMSVGVGTNYASALA